MRTHSPAGYKLPTQVTPDVAKLLRAREKAAGSGVIFTNGQIDSYPCYVSPALPSAKALFGDFSQVVIPTWATLEIGANPYAAVGFRAGLIQVLIAALVDVAVLRPSSFAKSESIT